MYTQKSVGLNPLTLVSKHQVPYLNPATKSLATSTAKYSKMFLSLCEPWAWTSGDEECAVCKSATADRIANKRLQIWAILSNKNCENR